MIFQWLVSWFAIQGSDLSYGRNFLLISAPDAHPDILTVNDLVITRGKKNWWRNYPHLANAVKKLEDITLQFSCWHLAYGAFFTFAWTGQQQSMFEMIASNWEQWRKVVMVFLAGYGWKINSWMTWSKELQPRQNIALSQLIVRILWCLFNHV